MAVADMINRTLFGRGIKKSLKMLVIFAAVITMYFTIIITMFDPSFESVLSELSKSMPELMNMVGMKQASAELVGFMEAYLYGFIMLVFPMIFSILSANMLIARHVDRGSMTYLLAAPVKRETVAFTQMTVMVSGLFLLVLYATLLGIIDCEITFPGELDIGKYLLLNIGVLVLHLFIGGICFLCSCIFSESKHAVGLSAGIAIFEYVIQMIANTGKELENAKYATLFTLFDSKEIVSGSSDALWGLLLLFIGAIILYIGGIVIFKKRDLHI